MKHQVLDAESVMKTEAAADLIDCAPSTFKRLAKKYRVRPAYRGSNKVLVWRVRSVLHIARLREIDRYGWILAGATSRRRGMRFTPPRTSPRSTT